MGLSACTVSSSNVRVGSASGMEVCFSENRPSKLSALPQQAQCTTFIIICKTRCLWIKEVSLGVIQNAEVDTVSVSPVKRTVLVFLLRELRVSKSLDERIKF